MLTRIKALAHSFPRQFWLMAAGLFISSVGASMIWPFLMIYVSEKLDLTLSTVSTLITINALVGLMASFLAGAFVDRYGRKVVMALSLFITGICYLFMSQAQSFLSFALIMVLMGFSNVFGHFQVWNGVHFPEISQLFASSGHYYLVVISLIILVLIPIVALIYGGIKILFNIKTKHPVLRAFVLTAWILSLILFVTLLIVNSTNYAVEATGSDSKVIPAADYPRIQIAVSDNTGDKKITVYRVFDHQFNYSEWDEELYSRPELILETSDDDAMHLTIEKKAKNVGMKNSQQYLDRINYNWEQQDSVLRLDKYLHTDEEDFWMFGEVDIRLRIPEGQVIMFTDDVCELLTYDQQYRYCSDSLLAGKSSVMTADGLMLLRNQKRPLNKNK